MRIKTLTLILIIITSIFYGQKGNVKNSQIGFLLGSLVPIDYFGRTVDEGKKIRFIDGIRAIYCLIKYKLKS